MAHDGVEGDGEGIGEHGRLVRDPVGHRDEHGVVGRQLLGPGAGRAGDDADVHAGAEVALGEAPAQAEVARLAGRARAGSMPRGAQVNQGLSTTRCPTSSPRASGPSATTSATTSCPGTWGREEKAAIGLSMSPVLKSPSTSLASEPQMPERMGRVITQSGRTRRASSISCRPKGMPRQHRLQLVLGGRPDLVLVRRCAEEQGLHCSVPSWPPRPRIPTMKLSMSDVLASMTAFMSGR